LTAIPLQPVNLVRNHRHCLPALSVQRTSLNVATNGVLDPLLGNYTILAVSRQTSSVDMQVVSRNFVNGRAEYMLRYGGATNAITSVMYARSASGTRCAAKQVIQSDTTQFLVRMRACVRACAMPLRVVVATVACVAAVGATARDARVRGSACRRSPVCC
jgi:hypothetical protein